MNRQGGIDTETIWNILGWLLGGLAVGSLLLAFLGDAVRRRFRRMRRCPKCWYDLSHTPGMTCSECGYTAKRERQLFRTRRRKRWVLVALLVWIGSCLAFRVPAMQQRGWVAAVPTTVLVFLWPRERVLAFYDEILADPELSMRLPLGSSVGGAPFTEELLRRIDRGMLNRLHWRLLVETAIRVANHSAPLCIDELEHRPLQLGMLGLAERAGRLNDSTLLRRALSAGSLRMATRSRWPVGVPVYAAVWRESLAGLASPASYRSTLSASAQPLTPGLALLSTEDVGLSTEVVYADRRSHIRMEPFFSLGCSEWMDYCIPLGTPLVESNSIQYLVSVERQLTESQARVVGTEVLKADVVMTFDCRIKGTIDNILSPVESLEFDAAMNEQWRPVLHEDHIHLNFGGLGVIFELLGGATFAVTLELLLNGEVVARGEAWWCVAPGPIAADGRPAPLVVPLCDYAPIDPITPHRINPKEGRYRLRLTPNPRMALRRFESDRYWAGQIEVPVAGQFTGEWKPEPLYGGSWP